MARAKALLWGIAVAAICAPAAAWAGQRTFDIASQPANRSIPEFARQAGIQVIAPGGKIRSLRTHAVKGRYDVSVALRLLLAGTRIEIISQTERVIVLGMPRQPVVEDGRNAPKPSKTRTAVVPTPLPLRPAGRLPEIVVTGSRIRNTAADSPVPLTVIDRWAIDGLTVGDPMGALRLAPQSIATQSDATAGTAFTSDVGASYANLRGLSPTFGSRTLVLVNGRRFVPSSTGAQVDLALIPSLMIGRVETVTGGASAAYGSDAVAGVINYVLDDDLRGLRAVADIGQTGHGDGRSRHVAAAYGRTWSQGRARLLVGAEYLHNQGIGRCAEVRAWCAQSWGTFVNAGDVEPGTLNTPANVSGFDVPGSSGYGQPNYLIGPNSRMAYNSPFGVVRNFTSPPGTSTTAFSANFPAIAPPLAAVDKVFNADGKGIAGYYPGAYVQKHVAGQAQGGDSPSIYSDQVVQTPQRRGSAFAALRYDLADRVTARLELSFAERHSSASSIVSTARSTMAIHPDNAFLPPDLVALLNGSSFSLAKDVDNELTNLQSIRSRVLRGALALDGELGAGWSWNAYYQYGKNIRHAITSRARHNDAFVMALDAVRDPTNPGKVICRPLDAAILANFIPSYRAELTELYRHCVPLNLFGVGNMDPAAVDFVWRKAREDFVYRQDVLSANLLGEVRTGASAGPFKFAAGVERRTERGRVTNGGAGPNTFIGGFGIDYAGRISVTEGYAEGEFPLLRDRPLASFAALNGAIRYTSNTSTDLVVGKSRKVGATSWKVGAIYDPDPAVRFRATASRDIRAAGFRELYQKTVFSDEGTVQGRVSNANISGPNKNDNTPIFTGGNFSLTPERAVTHTIGAVVTPAAVPGARISLDWYRIRLKDAIANLTGQRVADLCIGYQLLCERIAFASPTDIARIDAGQANVGRIAIGGFDFELAYRTPANSLIAQLPGTLDLALMINHQYDFRVKQSAAAPTIDYAGQSGPAVEGGDFYPTPKWMWTALAGLRTDRSSATLSVRHIGAGRLNAEWIGPDQPGYAPTLPNSVNRNRVAGRTYVALSLGRTVFGSMGGPRAEIFGLIDNLFDTDPPIAPGGTTSLLLSAYPTNPVYFDTFGRRWKAGLRITL